MRFSNPLGDFDLAYRGDLLIIRATWHDGSPPQEIWTRGPESNRIIAFIKSTEEKPT